MAKSLVIKNADFSVNKIETITFNDIPCTGASFNSSTISLSSIGPATVGFTVTPYNTTDDVILISSDISVVGASNGSFVVNGIGTCTLTLRCGAYSDTCTATVDIYETPIYAAGTIDVTTDPSDENISGVCLTGSSKSRAICTAPYSQGYFEEALDHVSQWIDVGSVTAIKIPENAQKIHIYATNVYGSDSVYFLNANDSYTKNDKKYIPITSKVTLSATTANSVKTYNEDVTVPTGATGYILPIRSKTSEVIGAINTESEMKQYVEETLGLSIHYLSA